MMGDYTVPREAKDWKDVRDYFQHSNGSLVGSTTDCAISNLSITRKLRSTLDTSSIL
jgi:hypothetical protein